MGSSPIRVVEKTNVSKLICEVHRGLVYYEFAKQIYFWDLSSAGRASALQAEGHRFEPYRSHLAGVAELADAQDLKSCGANPPYRFDSGRRHYQKAV